MSRLTHSEWNKGKEQATAGGHGQQRAGGEALAKLCQAFYLTIKSARSQQSSIQNIRSVGGSQDNDSCVALKAIHLCQQLVDGLLTLIIATTHASTTLSANSINLINEDNARRLSLCLQQQQVLSNGIGRSSKLSAVACSSSKCSAKVKQQQQAVSNNLNMLRR